MGDAECGEHAGDARALLCGGDGEALAQARADFVLAKRALARGPGA